MAKISDDRVMDDTAVEVRVIGGPKVFILFEY
jgi:hypothetical protein